MQKGRKYWDREGLSGDGSSEEAKEKVEKRNLGCPRHRILDRKGRGSAGAGSCQKQGGPA